MIDWVDVQAGQQMQAKAQGAVDAVKDATGMNKWDLHYIATQFHGLISF